MAPPPGDGPEPDWEDQKQEMLDARMRKWAQAPGAEDDREEGFGSLAGAWRGQVTIADDFDELPDDLTEPFSG